MIEAAVCARERAYAPYSGFKVGAALLTCEGKIYQGCNVENASYGLTVCAERVALLKAVSEGEKDFKALALVTDSAEPVSPCGACRQVMAEFAPEMAVIVANLQGKHYQTTVKELLPQYFSAKAFEGGGENRE